MSELLVEMRLIHEGASEYQRPLPANPKGSLPQRRVAFLGWIQKDNNEAAKQNSATVLREAIAPTVRRASIWNRARELQSGTVQMRSGEPNAGPICKEEEVHLGSLERCSGGEISTLATNGGFEKILGKIKKVLQY